MEWEREGGTEGDDDHDGRATYLHAWCLRRTTGRYLRLQGRRDCLYRIVRFWGCIFECSTHSKLLSFFPDRT